MKSISHRNIILLAGLFVLVTVLAGCQALPAAMPLTVGDVSPGTGDDLDTSNGLVTVPSDSSVAETAERLEAALRDRGLTVFAVIDHAANAESAGLALRPTRLVLAGNPNLGTLLMQESPTTAIDLPQKFLVWQDENGEVFITYNDPQYLARRHNIDGQDEVLETIANALANFAQGAATAPSTVADNNQVADNELENNALDPIVGQGETSYPNGDLLVDVAWLTHHLDDDALRIIDMRSTDAYSAGHIPGAVNIPVGQIASTINGIPLEFDRAAVQQALDEAGLTPEMTVVIYDNLGMMDAARLFWTLDYVGHADARILNGGWNAWTAAEGATTTDVPDVEPTGYPLALDNSKLVTAQEVLEQLDTPGISIVDARSPQEYSGEVVLAQRGGHIPGAVNLVWLDALTGGDTAYAFQDDWREQLADEDIEIFKEAAALQSMIAELGIEKDDEIITYCQTLWRGAHVYFLLRLMGYETVRGYDGSWAEWGNRPELPVVTGTAPGSLAEATTGSQEDSNAATSMDGMSGGMDNSMSGSMDGETTATPSTQSEAMQPADWGRNVALRSAGTQVVDASSVYNDSSLWAAENAIDGDANTAWSSAGDGDDAWIEIELAQESHITGVGMWTRSMANSSQIRRFQIRTGSGDVLGPFTLDDAASTHIFPVDVTVQRLRFEVVESNGGNTGAIELAVYTDEPLGD